MAPPPSGGSRSSSVLSGTWHGIPIPILGVGGGVAALLLYRRYKAGKSTTTSKPAAVQSFPASTGDSSGLGAGYSGTGFAGGGGGGGGALSDAINSLVQQLGSTSSNGVTPEGGTPDKAVPVDAQVLSGIRENLGTPAVAPPVSSPAPAAPGLPVAGGGVPFNYVRIFSPTGSNQTYYALGNKGEVAAAKAAGYNVVGGKTLAGGNPSANYAYR